MLTFNEIMEQTTKLNQKRYLDSFDYLRSIAFTKFLEYLSKKPSFVLMKASPKMICIFNKENNYKNTIFVPSIGLCADFQVNNRRYHIEINHNNLFNQFATIYQNDMENNKLMQYTVNIKEQLYKNTNYELSEQNQLQFIQNLNKIFEKLQGESFFGCAMVNKINAPIFHNKQAIYFN